MARRKTELSIFVAISFLVLLASPAPVLATSTHANSKWDRQEWLMGKITNSRPELFAQLLKQQNLIGLSRHKVEKLLGSPDNNDSYGIFHCCTAGIQRNCLHNFHLFKLGGRNRGIFFDIAISPVRLYFEQFSAHVLLSGISCDIVSGR